jgi:hypothetical protein
MDGGCAAMKEEILQAVSNIRFKGIRRGSGGIFFCVLNLRWLIGACPIQPFWQRLDSVIRSSSAFVGTPPNGWCRFEPS